MDFVLPPTDSGMSTVLVERGWGSHLRVDDMWQDLFVNFQGWRTSEDVKSCLTCHLDTPQTHTHLFKGQMIKWDCVCLCVRPRDWIKKQMRDRQHTALVRQHVCLPGHFWVHSYLYVCVCVLAPLTSLGALVRRFSRLFVSGYVFVPKGRSMGNCSRPNLIVAVQTDL